MEIVFEIYFLQRLIRILSIKIKILKIVKRTILIEVRI